MKGGKWLAEERGAFDREEPMQVLSEWEVTKTNSLFPLIVIARMDEWTKAFLRTRYDQPC